MRSGIVPTPRGAFAVREFAPEGPSAGLAPVICLHGFPDDASTFDAVAERLSQHGHPVTSVYLRGYDPSPTVGPYSMGGLGEDLIALATEVYGGQAVHFLGHDYGAQIAYSVLSQAPGLFHSAVLLAGAHPAAISRNTWRYPRQIWLSRYIIFFQFGRFADRRVARDDFAALDRLWDRWSPGGIDHEHRSTVKATIARSMPAPIAMYRGGGFSAGNNLITVPTLFIAGAEDRCTLPGMSDGQDIYFNGPYERQIWPGAGHFPQLEDPLRTAQSALEWFRTYDAS